MELRMSCPNAQPIKLINWPPGWSARRLDTQPEVHHHKKYHYCCSGEKNALEIQKGQIEIQKRLDSEQLIN